MAQIFTRRLATRIIDSPHSSSNKHLLMITLDEFTDHWRRLHHPTMDVSCDTAFFYELYCRLCRLAGQKAAGAGEQPLFSLLLYTENTIAVGLDGVYEYRYRSVGNMVLRWCESLDMGADAASQVDALISEAVAKASSSALRQWMTQSILSGDFLRLCAMLTWFPQKDHVLQRVFPDLRFREAMFLSLTGDRPTARQMLWADLAFNWRDKHGHSLAATIARQLRHVVALAEAKDKALLNKAAASLNTIRSERLDTYSVIERKDARTLTLLHRDGREFRDVIFPIAVPDNVQSSNLVAQLATYQDQTYLNGPAVWLNDEAQPVWNGETHWSDIIKKEQDAARRTYFTTTFGKRISLFDDLYTVPKDPDEATYSDMGIHFDEPNVFDFIEWLNPSDAVGGMAGQQA